MATAKAARAGATPLHRSLPDEIVFREILVRLPPKSLLRCHSVCRAWRRVTSTRDFLLRHHARQPSLPIVRRFNSHSSNYQNILTFDHRAIAAARFQPIARLGQYLLVQASCDGLLVLCKVVMSSQCFFVCNPTTREHALLWKAWGSRLLGMYRHRPTGEYRLLLHWSSDMKSFPGHPLPNGKIGCYVLVLGSDQPLRYIEGVEKVSTAQIDLPFLVRESLHWYQVQHQHENELVLVFDTIAESFRQMRPPRAILGPTMKSHIFEAEGSVGICGYSDAMENVDIWVLRNYEGEIWEHKYRVGLPVAEMSPQLGIYDKHWYVRVVSVDGGVHMLLKYDRWMFYIDMGGKLVDSFHHDSQQLYPSKLRLKQTLVPHTFFTTPTLEGYDVSKLPHYVRCLSRYVFMTCNI